MLPPTFFGTLREHYILLFSAAGVFSLGVGFIGAWIGARFGTRTALRDFNDSMRALASRSDLQTMSDELQAMLLEVERIAEGQRFVAKVLAERNDRPAFPAPRARREPGDITPH